MRIFQYGDIATRLKGALGLQGKDNWHAEDGVVPVVIAQDATRRIYAQEPRSAEGYGDITGAAAQSTLALTNTGPGVFHLTAVIVALATTGWVEQSRAGILPGGAASTKVMSDMSSKSPAGPGLSLPLLISQWTAVVATNGSIGAQYQVSASAALWVPVNHLLRLNECFFIKSQTNAIRLTVGFFGDYYPNADASV